LEVSEASSQEIMLQFLLTYLFEEYLWSFKFNGPGFWYEIRVSIATGLIVWLFGLYG
jgi:hypothetical protein